MLNTPVKSPFPSWVTKCDPITSNWEKNGFFEAFEARRQRREGLMGKISPRLYHLLKGRPVGLLLPVLISCMILYVFNSQTALICTGLFYFLYSVTRVILIVPWKSPTGLPLDIKGLLLNEKHQKQLDQIRLIPEGDGSLGEALLLESISNFWRFYTFIYWIIILALIILLNSYFLHELSLEMKLQPIQIISQIFLTLCVFFCAYLFKPLFCSKTNEYIAKQLLYDYQTRELKGAVNNAASALSLFLNYMLFLPGLLAILIFEVTATGLFTLFFLQWLSSLTPLSELYQTIAVQMALAMIFLSPFLYIHLIYQRVLKQREENNTEISNKIKEQVIRIIQTVSENRMERK